MSREGVLPANKADQYSTWKASRPFLLLLLPHCWIVGLALVARSQTGWALGYSRALLLFNAFNLLALIECVLGLERRALRTAVFSVAALILMTYVTGMNNELSSARYFLPLVLTSRFALAILLTTFAVFSHRERPASRSSLLLAAGASLITLTLFDTVGLAVLAHVKPSATAGFAFRKPVDFSRIEQSSVVMVGDSFVYGVHVAEAESFASVLGADLGPTTRVYNLGQSGAGLPEYLDVVKKVQSCERVVVCFYMNDIRSRETLVLKVRQAMASMGRTSLALRLVADLVGVRMLSAPAEN